MNRPPSSLGVRKEVDVYWRQNNGRPPVEDNPVVQYDSLYQSELGDDRYDEHQEQSFPCKFLGSGTDGKLNGNFHSPREQAASNLMMVTEHQFKTSKIKLFEGEVGTLKDNLRMVQGTQRANMAR